MFHGLTNKELFNKIRRSDEAAYEELYDRMATALMIYAYKRLDNDLEVAKDVVQEVFINIWERRFELDVPGHIDAFLYKSVLYNLLNKIRKEKSKSNYLEYFSTYYQSVGESVDEEYLEKEFFEILDIEIAALPTRMRQVFELRFYGQKTNDEVAGELGISKHTVATQMKRALKVLRGKLGKNYIWFLVILFY